MFATAPYAIVANRFVPHTDYVDIEGYDFTDAVINMTIRDGWNTGVVRAEITPTCEIVSGGGVDFSRITWVVPKATMITMPLNPRDQSLDVDLVYDIQIDPAGADPAFVALRGTFSVRAGATE